MANELVLLDLWKSPFAIRVRIALAEKGVEYVSREEDLKNKSALLLEMNPVNKQIPVLIHDGKPICESMIIVEYIDQVWDRKSPLLPTDPFQRAQARFWGDYVDKNIYSLGKKMLLGPDREAARKELVGCYKVLEEELGHKRFFGGEDFGYVDVALIPFYSWFFAYEQLGVNMVQECPQIVAWAKRCIEKESVCKTIPDQQKVIDAFERRTSRHIQLGHH